MVGRSRPSRESPEERGSKGWIASVSQRFDQNIAVFTAFHSDQTSRKIDLYLACWINQFQGDVHLGSAVAAGHVGEVEFVHG